MIYRCLISLFACVSLAVACSPARKTNERDLVSKACPADFGDQSDTVDVYPAMAVDGVTAWKSHLPDLSAETNDWQTYEVARQRVRNSDDIEAYATYLSRMPSDDVILGRIAEIMNYMINLDEYAHLSPDGRGRLYASVFKATGSAGITLYGHSRDLDAVDLVIAVSDILLARQNPAFGRVSDYNGQIEAGWASEMYGEFINETMTIGMVTMPMIELLQLARIDPDVAARVGRARCKNWVSQFDDILLQFDDSRDVLDGVMFYREPFMNPGEDERWFEAWNHVSAYGAALVKYTQLTGDPRGRKRVDEILDYYNKIVRSHDNGTVSWSYLPKPGVYDEKGEDVWKGSVSMEFPLAVWEAGFGLKTEHVRAIANILNRNIFLEDGRRDRSIDPGYWVDLSVSSSSELSMLSGWSRLACFDPEIVDRITNIFVNEPDVLPGGFLNETRIAIRGLVDIKYFDPEDCPAGTLPNR